jgi:hypothetical protein
MRSKLPTWQSAKVMNMSLVCRWLLIGLLIMTLPLKGLAAAGYLGCGPLHAEATAKTHDRGHATHASQGHEDGTGTHAVKSDEHGQATTESVGSSDQKPVKSVQKCTQCAPCCGAVAPPVTGQLLLSVGEPSELKVAVRLLELGGDSDRLDRPPRSILV